jgi:hypothetical protein
VDTYLGTIVSEIVESIKDGHGWCAASTASIIIFIAAISGIIHIHWAWSLLPAGSWLIIYCTVTIL